MFVVYDNLGEAVEPYSSEQFSNSHFRSKSEAVTYATKWSGKLQRKISIPRDWDGSKVSLDECFIEIKEE